MRISLLIAVVVVVGGVSGRGGDAAAKGAKVAKKPTAAQAVEVAGRWASQLEGEEAQPLTAAVFSAKIAIDGPGEVPCANATAKDPAAVGTLLACVREHARFGHELAPIASAKALKKAVPYLARWRSALTAAMTGATLVFAHSECAGEGSDAAIAVVLDADGAPKVSAIYFASVFCGE